MNPLGAAAAPNHMSWQEFQFTLCFGGSHDAQEVFKEMQRQEKLQRRHRFSLFPGKEFLLSLLWLATQPARRLGVASLKGWRSGIKTVTIAEFLYNHELHRRFQVVRRGLRPARGRSYTGW
jgi:hypothetical protein